MDIEVSLIVSRLTILGWPTERLTTDEVWLVWVPGVERWLWNIVGH